MPCGLLAEQGPWTQGKPYGPSSLDFREGGSRSENGRSSYMSMAVTSMDFHVVSTPWTLRASWILLLDV